jgi:hypothetical protein
MKIIKQHIQRFVKFIAFSYLIYSIVHFAHGTIHNYKSQSEKILASQYIFMTTCDGNTILRWPGLLDMCIHHKNTAEQNAFWETFVESSKLLHPCSQPKDHHGDPHDHEETKIECSYTHLIFICLSVLLIALTSLFNRFKNIIARSKVD